MSKYEYNFLESQISELINFAADTLQNSRDNTESQDEYLHIEGVKKGLELSLLFLTQPVISY